MNGNIRTGWMAVLFTTAAFSFVCYGCSTTGKTPDGGKEISRAITVQLPGQDSNLIRSSWPSIGCWFWSKEEFQPDGFKRFIDLQKKYTPFTLLTTSLRYPGELTDPKIHDQIKAGSEYARKNGLGIVMDLDLRLAREAFSQRYPDEMQQIVLLREFPLKNNGNAGTNVVSPSFADHYTYGRSDYVPMQSDVLRIYRYKKRAGLIDPATLTDISDRKIAGGNKDSISVTVNCGPEDEGFTACALVAVKVYTPDVFAPHLLSYQREILQQYSDASLAGACKDEWGFPGRFEPKSNDLWYSPFMAEAYARKIAGHDLLRDMLLMAYGENGREGERAAAINHYMEMCWQRNSEIETDYYHAIKEIYGRESMSGTHATWFPFPDHREIFKNGLSWWTAKRDLAQTDESTPFPVRTSLAKKMRSPVWYNMYYEGSLKEYQKDLWISVLGGGRLNYHPVWPDEMTNLTTSILQDSLLIAETRVNMLNHVSTAPVDCPVAVVFGHSSALNWAQDKGFADVGLSLTDELWKQGYYADLIPSSEITNGSLIVNSRGKVQYGPQEYAALIVYNPEYNRREMSTFFADAGKGFTELFRMGNWTTDFDGRPFNGNAVLPQRMKNFNDAGKAADAIISSLQAKGIGPYTTGEMRSNSGFPKSVMPKASGHIRLIDGTVIQASGVNNVMGDPIRSNIKVDGKDVEFDAMGVAAIRFSNDGQLEALAAGGLKSVNTPSFKLELQERKDVVLIREKGKLRGILFGSEGVVPKELLGLTDNWEQVGWPAAYPKKQ